MKGRITLNTREQTRARVLTMVIEGRCRSREAARLVQLSERQVLRLKKGLREQGPAAFAHGNHRISGQRQETRDWVLDQFD
jgi:hypothetical protein